jgi:choline-sulfatase
VQLAFELDCEGRTLRASNCLVKCYFPCLSSVRSVPLPSPFRRTFVRSLLCLAAATGLASHAGARAPAAAAAPPNVVLLTLDTTRADHLGSAGWPHASTPNLDALARRGVRFARCDSAAPVTLPSHATILSGLFPPRHGVRDNGTFVLPAAVPTLAEHFAAGGYDTAAVVSAVVLSRRHGLDQGFRIYDDDLGAGASAGTQVAERPAEAATTAALALLAGLRPPFFLWVHYYDPHEEYRPPSRFADAARGPSRLYDGEIAYMDSEIGRLLAALPAKTIVAAVGDHGEMLGEHGELTHGVLPFAGSRRVPFLLAGPGVPEAQVSECLTRTADVTPTLLALAGLPAPAGLDGEALLGGANEGDRSQPELLEESRRWREGSEGSESSESGGRREPGASACTRVAYSESFLPFYAYKWYPLRTLSDGRALYLQAPDPGLFRLDVDPGEAHDLAPSEPALARLWGIRLERLLAAAGEKLEEARSPQATLDEEQRRQLASLGYLSGAGATAGVVANDLPDPRARIGIAQALHTAAARIQQGACPEVLRELERIVREDPHNFPALALAGQCLRDAGRHAEALTLYRRAAEENPASAVPVANVAGSLLRLGRRDEAEREFRHALVLDPTESDSAANLARLWRENGRAREAEELLDRTIAAGALGAQLFLERGTMRAAAGRLADGLQDFREAARRAPTDPLPVENAARAAFQLGRLREAALTYETLARLAPARADVWKTLVALYLELDEAGQVERCAREALRIESDPAERARLEELLATLTGAAR